MTCVSVTRGSSRRAFEVRWTSLSNLPLDVREHPVSLMSVGDRDQIDRTP